MLVLWGFYALFLEKENMHYTKRFYLIFSLVFALSIPLITFTYTTNTPPIRPEIIEHAQIVPEVVAYQVPLVKPSVNYLVVFLWSVYGIGVFIFGYRFFKNLNQLLVQIKNNQQLREPSHINVLLVETVIPFTFLKYIFLSKKEYQLNNIPEEVLLHEKTHVVQKHTLDILFIEVLQVIFWFNPLLILIKKSIKLNHEFLADQTVLKRQFSLHTYMNMLVNYPNNSNQVELSSPINYSLTKKRIVMMSQQFSKTRAAARLLLLLPILLGCMLLFNNQIIAQQKNSNYTKTIQDTHPDKKIKIRVADKQITVNGSATKLSDFAKTIDQKTKQWKDNELTEFHFDIQIQNSDDSFVNRLNKEYKKTRLYLANPDGHDLIPEEPPLPRVSKIKVNTPPPPKSIKIQNNKVAPPVPPSPPSPLVDPDVDIDVDIDEIEEEVELSLKEEAQARIEEAHEYEIENAMRIAEHAREAAESARMIAMEESHRTFERLHEEREMAEHARTIAIEAAHRARDHARQHAKLSRLEAEKVREMAMREAQRARKEIILDKDKLREEARAAAEKALQHAEKARKEAIQEAQKIRKQARKIADEARKEALKELEKARKESEKERRKSRRERNRL